MQDEEKVITIVRTVSYDIYIYYNDPCRTTHVEIRHPVLSASRLDLYYPSGWRQSDLDLLGAIVNSEVTSSYLE
jgi:hypothetical protein